MNQNQGQRQQRPQGGPEFSVTLSLTEPFMVGDEWFTTAMIQVKHRSKQMPDPSVDHNVDVYRNGKLESSQLPLDRNGVVSADIRLDASRMNSVQTHYHDAQTGQGYSSSVQTVFVPEKKEEKRPERKLLPPLLTRRIRSARKSGTVWEFSVRVQNEDKTPVSGVCVLVGAETIEVVESTNDDGFTSFEVSVSPNERVKYFTVTALGPGNSEVSASAYYKEL